MDCRLKTLKNLSLEYNAISSVSESIGYCENLEFLSLNRNYLSSLPSTLGLLKNLKELRLSNSGALLNLPETICDLRQLEILQIDGGVVVPTCLLTLQVNRLKIIMD